MPSALFSPIRLAELELANRIVVSPMCQYSADDGSATDWHLGHLSMLANSGAALVVVEATHVERHGRITHGCLGLYSDANEAALARVVAHCRRAGTAKLGIQIAHAGRKASSYRPWEGGGALKEPHDPWPTIAPSAIPFGEGWHTPRAMTGEDFVRVRNAFVEAAKRAVRIGFDSIELHYAHAYTMASFLSRLNDRDDGYGGSPEGRVRLPLEVLAAVRARVGADYVVGIRYLGDEVVAGGSRVEDAVHYGLRFAEAGADYLSISKGGRFEDARQPRIGEAVYPYTGESGYECMPTVLSDERGPFGRNVPLAAAVRRALRAAGHATPVVTSGGISTFEQAEAILAAGEADFVAAARQTLADPDWFRKIRLGLGHLVRRCQFTNYCEGLDQRHKQVTCKLWDREGLDEPGVALASDGRRRLLPPSWEPPAGYFDGRGV